MDSKFDASSKSNLNNMKVSRSNKVLPTVTTLKSNFEFNDSYKGDAVHNTVKRKFVENMKNAQMFANVSSG